MSRIIMYRFKLVSIDTKQLMSDLKQYITLPFTIRKVGSGFMVGDKQWIIVDITLTDKMCTAFKLKFSEYIHSCI